MLRIGVLLLRYNSNISTVDIWKPIRTIDKYAHETAPKQVKLPVEYDILYKCHLAIK